jgi:geranylgeranyl diphosphate synthase type II
LTDVQGYLAAHARRVDEALERFLSSYEGVPEGLHEALRYSLFPGGKRLRPALTLGACEAVCGAPEAALAAACAIELIHTYSLVHDDLPCMDDDAIRRGLPTVHRKYGEATAVLVGDGLQAMAFEMLTHVRSTSVARDIAQASGPGGMVGGQYLDVEAEGKRIPFELVRRLHRLKTGALIRVAARAGAKLGKGTSGQVTALTHYGEHLGLAFQIVDDILDETGDDDVMGKRTGKDRARNKSTYPSLVGLAEARRLADEAKERAMHALTAFGPQADPLRSLAEYVVSRRR